MGILIFLLLPISTTIADDKSAIEDLFKSFTITPSGWSSRTHFCKWEGLSCDSDFRVISINLTSQALNGNLSFLQQVYLDTNDFTSIPPGAFSGLTSLQTLSLSFHYNLSPWPFPSELTDSTNLVTFHAINTQMHCRL